MSEDIIVDKVYYLMNLNITLCSVYADTTGYGNCLYNTVSCFLIKEDLFYAYLYKIVSF